MTTKGMVIDIRSDSSLYVTIGQKTFYIDDSTSEAIMDWWPTDCALNKRRGEKQMNIDYNTLPDRLRHGMKLYVDHGIDPGSFLMAVLTNNLIGALNTADPNNLRDLKEIVNWFHGELPGGCWGTEDVVENWIRSKHDDN